VSFYR